MAAIDISSTAAPLNDGVLQLQNGVAMDSTLRNVADQNNTTSPLKLSTTAVQVVSPLRITTDDPSDMYLDCEDGATNNRFNITRNTASQQVNLNFASNPAGSTTNVGAIRTYVDGVNLSEVMTFREDGKIGVNNNSPVREVDVVGVVQASNLWTSNGNPVIGSYGTDILLGTNASSKIVMVANRTDIVVNNVDVARFSQTGNFLLNSTASDTARLSIKGSGSTSATTSLLVQNSLGSEALKVTDDKTITFRGNSYFNSVGLRVSGDSGNIGGISFTGTPPTANQLIGAAGLVINTSTTFSSTTGSAMNFSTSEVASTSGDVANFGFGGQANMQSGNASFSQLKLVPNFTTGGTYSGIVRGIYYNPSLTSVIGITSHRAIETTTGGAYFNTSSVNASAILQADSTTQGFLPPRMTNAQRAAITTPAIGLMVYCTDAVEGLYVYKSTGWTFVI